MSTLSDGARLGLSKHFLLPSPHHPCTICISLLNKSYALPPSVPPGPTTHLPGLTFIADSFYDYENPWHGLNAVAPFFEWMRGEEGRCERARRLVFFKRGEVVRRVCGWVDGVVRVGMGREVDVDGLRGYNGTLCFERAVVMRRGVGGMEGRRRNGVFGVLRCRASRECGVVEREGEGEISVGWRVERGGGSGMRAGREVMERVCEGVAGGCRVSVYRFTRNMSFSEQV